MRGQVKVYQKKIVAKRRRRAFFLFLYFTGALALILCGLSYVSHLESLTLTSTIVQGNSRLSSSTVEALVSRELAGNYWYFFSRENTLLYPKESILRVLKDTPLVKRADVSRRGLQTLVVNLDERVETARWCAEGISDCYSVDESGFIFAPALCGQSCVTLATSTDDIIYRGFISGDPIGKQILTPSEFKNIQFFMRELDGLSVDPREAELSGTGYMTVTLGRGGRFVINRSDNLSVILSNIASVISDKAVAPTLSQFLETLDYMKLDTGNKIVYKLKAGVTTKHASSTAQ